MIRDSRRMSLIRFNSMFRRKEANKSRILYLQPLSMRRMYMEAMKMDTFRLGI